jgi:hypothetical protein
MAATIPQKFNIVAYMDTEAFPIVPLYFEKVSEKSIYPISYKTRYDYNLTIMESPILARQQGDAFWGV